MIAHQKKAAHTSVVHTKKPTHIGDFYTEACSVSPYVDPKVSESDSYILAEKSDIYSLGKIH